MRVAFGHSLFLNGVSFVFNNSIAIVVYAIKLKAGYYEYYLVTLGSFTIPALTFLL